MKFVIWVPSCHLKVFIAETTKIPCLYNHVHFMKALVLRAMFLWPVTSDGLWDGDSVYEADLVCIQSQRSWRADGEPLTPTQAFDASSRAQGSRNASAGWGPQTFGPYACMKSL